MASSAFLGKLLSINHVTNTVTFKYSFLDAEGLKMLEDLATSKEVVRHTVKSNIRKPKSYAQLTRFFAMVKAIIIDTGFPPISENVLTFRKDYVAENYFPKKQKNIEFLEKVYKDAENLENFNLEIEEPKALSKLTSVELTDVMEKVSQDYSEIFSSEDWYNKNGF